MNYKQYLSQVYSLKQFDDLDAYHQWKNSELTKAQAVKLQSHMNKLMNSDGPNQYKAFFDYLAKEGITHVILSKDTDAIHWAGKMLNQHLPDSGIFLSLGSSIGYHECWLAKQDSGRQVIGIDFSAAAIGRASSIATQQDFQNVIYQIDDFTRSLPDEQYDGIIAANVLRWNRDRVSLFGQIFDRLPQNGGFYIITKPQTEPYLSALVEELTDADLGVDQYTIEYHNDLGKPSAQLFLLCRPGNAGVISDPSTLYTQIRLSLQCLRWIGMSIQVSDEDEVSIEKTWPWTRAQNLGLTTGDVIQEIGGKHPFEISQKKWVQLISGKISAEMKITGKGKFTV